MKRIRSMTIAVIVFVLATACPWGFTEETINPDVLTAPYLYYIGHASIMIETVEGTVVYIDPYAEGDYDKPADLILITHAHGDHNHPELPARNDDCVVITWAEALIDGVYHSFDVKDISIQAVPAANGNHPIDECVGYILTFDDISVYHAGDTSLLDSMAELAALSIDYALYPVDGRYNMDTEEAEVVAGLVKASHNIPIHFMDPSMVDALQEAFTPENALYLDYGDRLILTH